MCQHFVAVCRRRMFVTSHEDVLKETEKKKSRAIFTRVKPQEGRSIERKVYSWRLGLDLLLFGMVLTYYAIILSPFSFFF